MMSFRREKRRNSHKGKSFLSIHDLLVRGGFFMSKRNLLRNLLFAPKKELCESPSQLTSQQRGIIIS